MQADRARGRPVANSRRSFGEVASVAAYRYHVMSRGVYRLKEGGMDRDTFDGTIRAFKHRTPFRPFTVAMANGDRLEVDHPDALAVRDGVALFAAPGGVPVVFDHESVSQVVGDLAERTST
jgi:hypothetical protein